MAMDGLMQSSLPRRTNRTVAQRQPNAGHWLDSFFCKARAPIAMASAPKIRIANQYAEMTTTVGYASSADCGVHFGLGNTETVSEIRITWPSGAKQTLTNIKANQVLAVTEPR